MRLPNMRLPPNFHLSAKMQRVQGLSELSVVDVKRIPVLSAKMVRQRGKRRRRLR